MRKLFSVFIIILLNNSNLISQELKIDIDAKPINISENWLDINIVLSINNETENPLYYFYINKDINVMFDSLLNSSIIVENCEKWVQCIKYDSLPFKVIPTKFDSCSITDFFDFEYPIYNYVPANTINFITIGSKRKLNITYSVPYFRGKNKPRKMNFKFTTLLFQTNNVDSVCNLLNKKGQKGITNSNFVNMESKSFNFDLKEITRKRDYKLKTSCSKFIFQKKSKTKKWINKMSFDNLIKNLN